MTSKKENESREEVSINQNKKNSDSDFINDFVVADYPIEKNSEKEENSSMVFCYDNFF